MDNRNQARWVCFRYFISKSNLLYRCTFLSCVILNPIQCLFRALKSQRPKVQHNTAHFRWLYPTWFYYINHWYLVDSSSREFRAPVVLAFSFFHLLLNFRSVFLGKTLNSHSASLHPGVQMGTGEFNAGGNPAMDWHPIQGGVEILLVASCHRNRS